MKKVHKYIIAVLILLTATEVLSKEKFKIVASEDSLCTVQIPEKWSSGVKLNDMASLQIHDQKQEFFLIAIIEDKEDISNWVNNCARIRRAPGFCDMDGDDDVDRDDITYWLEKCVRPLGEAKYKKLKQYLDKIFPKK